MPLDTTAQVTVVFTPTPERQRDFDQLLMELKQFLLANPPDGMASLTILRTETRAVLVQGRWRDRAAQRAFRASAAGLDVLKRLSDCCDAAPVTYSGLADPSVSLSFTDRDGASRG